MIKFDERFKRDILKNPSYWIPVQLVAVLCYAFSTLNRSINIDDLAREYYVGKQKAMIAATRWGMVLWERLFSSVDFTPFFSRFISVVLMEIGVLLLCYLFYRYLGDSKRFKIFSTFFSCLYLSYPLINEIWEYSVISVSGNIILIALTIINTRDNRQHPIKSVVISAALLSIVVSSYEASAFQYITIVLVVLLLENYCLGLKSWFLRGIQFAIPLIGAVLLRIIVGFSLISAFGIDYASNGATSIAWFSKGIRSSIMDIAGIAGTYFVRGLVYFPLGEFVIAVLIFHIIIVVFCRRKKSIEPAVIGVLILISLFFLSVVQGVKMPYRTAMTIQFFVPFVFALAFEQLSSEREPHRTICMVLLALLCLRQSVFLNQILALNNQRSDNEARVISIIGYKIQTEYEQKPVVFTGGLNLGNSITKQIYADRESFLGGYWGLFADSLGLSRENDRYNQSVKSVINWCTWAYGGQHYLGEYFSYYGYDIEVYDKISNEERAEFLSIATEYSMKPLEIKDMGEYVLVYLGDEVPDL